MTGRLHGQVAIVTGAGAGIGRGIARRFAAEGATVVVAELHEEAGRRVAEELTDDFGAVAVAIRTDVGRKEDVAAMIDAAAGLGRIDVLVNNAWGGGTVKRLEHKTDAEFEHGLRVGYWGAWWAMRAVFPVMRSQERGRIINLCSLNGVNAHLYTAEYNVAKEAIRALTRTAAREWARHGITANAVCPAAATEAYRAFAAAAPENAAELLRQNPMGRMGDPEADIAPVALFLASDDSRYLTGNTLFVDGGSHINGVAWDPGLPE